MKNIGTGTEFKEICTEALGRLETLQDYFFYAKQNDDGLDADINDAIKLEQMTENVANGIRKHLAAFLIDNGVTRAEEDDEEKEAY